MSTDELWNEYNKTKSIEDRNKLVLAYLPIIKRIVNNELHGSVNFHLREEYYSNAVFGLIDAVKKYNCLKNVKFETYATIRIKGSIKDYIRKQDWLPRGIRDKYKKIERAKEYLAEKLGREPSDREIAEQAGITLIKYYDTIEKITYANIVSFEDAISKGLNSQNMISQNNTETIIEKRELEERLMQEIDRLTEKEQLVISLYYREDLKLKEIGAVMKISESRVSQIIKKAITKLKTGMYDYI